MVHAAKGPCSHAPLRLKSLAHSGKDALVSQLRRFSLFAICLVAAVSSVQAQQKEDADDFSRDVWGALFNGNWNVYLNGGLTTNGDFLMQRTPAGGERVLTSEGSWNVGGGVGVDILKRTGVRLGYTYSSGDLSFLTDMGDGSQAFDAKNLTGITTHVVDLELLNYMTPAHSSIAPYAAIGLSGAWFSVGDGSALILQSGGSTQYRWGALASFGVQFHLGDGLFTQLEASSHSFGNPFSGGHSFTALGGTTIDEPSRVNKTDYRVVFVYRFGTIK